MKRMVGSPGYGYFKLLMSAAFVVMGVVLIVRIFWFGISFSILPGLILGVALIGLGVVRIRTFIQMRGML
ncbi:MAG: hypothetical protein M3Y21_08370 [Candidatus Eremiobacteraeota bacterium]|nr:hypothetical protein [Candidatus Eremiobacteraeota bacterium]